MEDLPFYFFSERAQFQKYLIKFLGNNIKKLKSFEYLSKKTIFQLFFIASNNFDTWSDFWMVYVYTVIFFVPENADSNFIKKYMPILWGLALYFLITYIET